MSETDRVMYISRRNDENDSLKLFRISSLFHVSSIYFEITDTTKISEIAGGFALFS